jgi:flagellin
MAQVINTNIASLNAQRNLTTSQNSLNTSLQRLSSGLRINSAKDDAAGLAISERMTSQIKGLSVASRNANDGISLAQTAEGALSEIGSNLQRIRELAVQSSNATNSQSDRDALQSEVSQLVAEIDRVANQTTFNGTKLLDGSFTSKLFQVGADSGQTIGINSIVDANADMLGGAKFDTNSITVPTPTATTADLEITGFKIADTAGNDVTFDDIVIAKDSGTAAEMQSAAQKAFINAINAKMDQTGVYAEADATTAGKINLTSVKNSVDKDGAWRAINVTAGTWTNATAPTFTATASAASNEYANDLDISDFTGAQQALEIVDKALSAVNTSRADMGAVQNRFSSTIANLATSTENLSAARSRIQDADYAVETANLSRTQILQQAGTAMLAQAKALPQNVLSLLQ